MRDMRAVHPRFVSYVAPADARGDQPLAPKLERGVKVFDLEASVIRWTILPGVTVEAYAFNRQVPGPRIRVTEGDRVRINVTNSLPEPTAVHWLIIEPREPNVEARADAEYVIQLQEWLQRAGLTYPAMPMEGALPNYFTINGKAYPATDTVRLKLGQTIKLRFIGSNNIFIHPMHVHGGPFTVVARDGETLPPQARFDADTVNVGPGQRYDVIWRARKPGKWLVHCHIGHHTTNNNTETDGGGGLMLLIEVTA
jgi:FtsP/CotA-like multicopper oxidase with cupredoxin domain